MTEIERDRVHWLEVAIVAGLAGVPHVGGPMAVVAAELFDRRRVRVAELGTDLLADYDAAEVLDHLRSDERFGEVFLRAAEVTAVSSWAPKRRAMGAVVRAALDGDDAQLDESELLLVALERMEAPHFAALQRVDQASGLLENDVAGVDCSDIVGLTPPVLAALVSLGTVTQESGYGGLFYRSSSFGRRLLALVTS